jgi:hypothetical protein
MKGVSAPSRSVRSEIELAIRGVSVVLAVINRLRIGKLHAAWVDECLTTASDAVSFALAE